MRMKALKAWRIMGGHQCPTSRRLIFIALSSIFIIASSPDLLQDEVGAHEVELLEDQVELNQDELDVIVLAEEVSIDNFALIFI